jgi:hypothetical protein
MLDKSSHACFNPAALKNHELSTFVDFPFENPLLGSKKKCISCSFRLKCRKRYTLHTQIVTPNGNKLVDFTFLHFKKKIFIKSSLWKN